jgi:hypothetical protein
LRGIRSGWSIFGAIRTEENCYAESSDIDLYFLLFFGGCRLEYRAIVDALEHLWSDPY